MTTCARCTREIPSALASCAHCAVDAGASGSAPDLAAPAGAPAPQPDAPRARSRILPVALAVGGGAVITLAMLLPATSRAPAPTSRPPSPGRAGSAGTPAVSAKAVSERTSATPVPHWSSTRQSRWISNHPRSVAFELEAEERIAVWMDHVRPVLVLRCLAGKTDAFVFTETAARIEQADENHTVELALDGSSAAVERWPDSADHDALFAPDAEAFARRLAGARTLRFGFTPHNAQPVTATFDLSGAEAVVDAVSRTCRRR